MPFHHIDQDTLQAARQTMAHHSQWGEAEPVLLQNPAPGAPDDIATLAMAIIRWWVIRRTVGQRHALPRRQPGSTFPI